MCMQFQATQGNACGYGCGQAALAEMPEKCTTSAPHFASIRQKLSPFDHLGRHGAHGGHEGEGGAIDQPGVEWGSWVQRAVECACMV
jgi:hypothetical protein